MRYVVIEEGVVINIIECDDTEFAMSISAVECDDTITVGMLYDAENGFLMPDFAKSVDEYRAEKLLKIKQWHDEQTNLMRAKYSKAEIDSFLDKRNEAMAWRVNSDAPTPYIDAMTGSDNEQRTALIEAVLRKVDQCAQLESFVLLTRDQINAATSIEELEAISWTNITA